MRAKGQSSAEINNTKTRNIIASMLSFLLHEKRLEQFDFMGSFPQTHRCSPPVSFCWCLCLQNRFNRPKISLSNCHKKKKKKHAFRFMSLEKIVLPHRQWRLNAPSRLCPTLKKKKKKNKRWGENTGCHLQHMLQWLKRDWNLHGKEFISDSGVIFQRSVIHSLPNTVNPY